jgi:hypothetical protein
VALQSSATQPGLDTPPERTFADGELVLGRFRIVRFIKSGGMGEVFEAYGGEIKPVFSTNALRPQNCRSAADRKLETPHDRQSWKLTDGAASGAQNSLPLIGSLAGNLEFNMTVRTGN